MKRTIPGLHLQQRAPEPVLEGWVLTQVEQARFRYHPQKPFFSLRFSILEPQGWASESFSGRIYCTPRALWKLHWFLQDFGYDPDRLERDEVDEKALVNLRGAVRLSRTRINGHCFLNLDGFAPLAQWEELSTSEQHEQPAENFDDL